MSIKDIIESNFFSILDREPDPKEIAHIGKLIAANGVRDDDAFLMVIVIEYANKIATNEAIQKGQDSIKSILEKGKNDYDLAVKKAIVSVKQQANESVNNVVNSAIDRIATDAASKLAESANSVNKNMVIKWAIVAAIVLAISHSIVYYFAIESNKEQNSISWNAGYNHAMNELKEDKIRSEWANTTIGKKAYKMDNNGDLADIITCARSGWYVNKNKNGNRICIPTAAKDGQYGWIMP